MLTGFRAGGSTPASPGTPPVVRKVAARFLLVLGAWGVVAGAAGLWARTNLLDPEGFASLVERTLGRPEIQDAFADLLAPTLVEQGPPGLRAHEPEIRSAVRAVVANPSFAAVASGMAEQAHRFLLGGPGGVATLDLSAMVERLRATLAERHPRLAARLPNALRLEALGRVRQRLQMLQEAGAAARTAAVAVPLFGLLCTAAGFLLSPRRLRDASVFGLTVATGAALFLVGTALIGSFADPGSTASAGLLPALGATLTGELAPRMWLLLGVGMAFALGGWLLAQWRSL